MTGVDRAPLVEWVARWGEPGRKITFFGLNQVIGIERSSPLGNEPWSCPKSAEARAAEAEAVVDRLVRDAETWAATQSRPQTYCISAHSGSSFLEAPAVTAIPFVVVPRGDLPGRDELDPRDITGGQQRLIGDLLRAFGTNQQQDKDRLVEENMYLRDTLRAFDRIRKEEILERERILNEKSSRDMAVEERRVVLETKRALFAAGREWIGRRLFEAGRSAPAQADPLALLATLSPEQRAAASPLLLALLGGTEIPPEGLLLFARGLSLEQAALAKPIIDRILSAMTPERQEEVRRLARATPAPTNGTGAVSAHRGRESGASSAPSSGDGGGE